jgi:serine/threonine-protein kinase
VGEASSHRKRIWGCFARALARSAVVAARSSFSPRDLGPVFSKALAKTPEGRYNTCVEFAEALARRLGTVADETDATEATALALPASGPRHRSPPKRAIDKPSQPNLKILIAVLVALLVVVTVIAGILFVVHVL